MEKTKMVDEAFSTDTVQHDEENRRIINMTVRDDTDFLSPFSKGLTPVISADVAEYLENMAKAALPSEELVLRIRSDCVDKNEEVLYRKAIREYYGNSNVSLTRDIKRSIITAVALFITGLLILVLTYWVGKSLEQEFFSEVFDIMSWVLIWEATDISLLQMHSMRIEQKRYCALIHMKIEFYPL